MRATFNQLRWCSRLQGARDFCPKLFSHRPHCYGRPIDQYYGLFCNGKTKPMYVGLTIAFSHATMVLYDYGSTTHIHKPDT